MREGWEHYLTAEDEKKKKNSICVQCVRVEYNIVNLSAQIHVGRLLEERRCWFMQ